MKPETWLRWHPIPARVDGSGVCWIQAANDTFEEMRIADWPSPTEQGHDGRGGGIIQMPANVRRGVCGRYRSIRATRFTETTGRPMTSMFALSSKHTNQTLLVIAQGRRDVNAPWAGLASETGARLWHIAFAPTDGGVFGGREVVQ